jgi:hypothetical protein
MDVGKSTGIECSALEPKVPTGPLKKITIEMVCVLQRSGIKV